MTIEANLVSQGGMWDGVAKAIVGNQMVVGLVGAGTTQATALALPLADYAVFSTVVANSGAILPAAGGAEINVLNMGVGALLVYPPIGGNVNLAAANVGFAVAAGKNCQFQTPDGVTWFATHST